MGIYLGGTFYRDDGLTPLNNKALSVPRIYVGKGDKARRVTKIYKGVNGKASQIYEYVDERKNAVKFSSDGDFELRPYQGMSLGSVNLEFSTNEGLTQTRQTGGIVPPGILSPLTLTGNASQPIYLRGTGNTVLGSLNVPQHFTGKYIDGNLENLLDYQTVKAGGHPTMGRKCFISMFQDCTTLERGADLYADVATEECCANLYKGCTNLLEIPQIDFLIGRNSPTGGTLANLCCSEMFMNCSSLRGFSDPSLRGIRIDSLQQSCFVNMFKGCSSLVSMKPIYIYNSTVFPSQCCLQMFQDCTSLIVPPNFLMGDSMMVQNQTNFANNSITRTFSGCSALKVKELAASSQIQQTTIIQIPTGISMFSCSDMFKNTGGTFTGTPRAGYRYDFYT